MLGRLPTVQLTWNADCACRPANPDIQLTAAF